MKRMKTSIKALSIAVLAASQVSFADTNAMEEIIVTAQKRDQSVLDVAATMDVISAEFLERTNTTELDDLSRVLPNVVIQEQAVSLLSFNIRGITDASVMLNRKGSSIKYELYADNVFDEDYLIDAGNTGGGIGIPTYVPGMPMIAGVRLYVDF